MDLEVIKQNGEKFLLSDYDVVVQDIKIYSIPMLHNRQRIDGIAGSLSYGTEYGDRKIEVTATLIAKDLHDYAHLRDELFNLLNDSDGYYVRELRRLNKKQYEFIDLNEKPKEKTGTDNSYVDGKQYHVELDGEFEFEQDDVYGSTTINFKTSGLPFAESIYTTKELNDSGYSALVEKYGLVDSIHDEYQQYKFTERNFTVWNAGNVTIEPEMMYLKIIVTGTNGVLEIRNKTTGDVFKVNAEFGGDLVIDGINAQLKSTNVFRDTNKRFINLTTGKNDFEIIGRSNDITIDFRFYYK